MTLIWENFDIIRPCNFKLSVSIFIEMGWLKNTEDPDHREIGHTCNSPLIHKYGSCRHVFHKLDIR